MMMMIVIVMIVIFGKCVRCIRAGLWDIDICASLRWTNSSLNPIPPKLTATHHSTPGRCPDGSSRTSVAEEYQQKGLCTARLRLLQQWSCSQPRKDLRLSSHQSLHLEAGSSWCARRVHKKYDILYLTCTWLKTTLDFSFGRSRLITEEGDLPSIKFHIIRPWLIAGGAVYGVNTKWNQVQRDWIRIRL